MRMIKSISALAFLLLAISATDAADWPQWMGPNRDGVWTEDGIVREVPSTGLKVKWRVPVGLGYSGQLQQAG